MIYKIFFGLIFVFTIATSISMYHEMKDLEEINMQLMYELNNGTHCISICTELFERSGC